MSRGVESFLNQSMSVAQLIEFLQDFPEDARVVLCSDYGDYGHTIQAANLTHVHEVRPRHFTSTGYSVSGFAIKDRVTEDLPGCRNGALCVVVEPCEDEEDDFEDDE